MILFLVTTREESSHVVLVTARGRDSAASKAQSFLGGFPYDYVVTPLTENGAKVDFDLSITL